MSRTIQDAVAEIKAAFPECDAGYTIDGPFGTCWAGKSYIENANGLTADFPIGSACLVVRINRDLAEDEAFDVVGHVRNALGAYRSSRRPLDGMRMKGSG